MSLHVRILSPTVSVQRPLDMIACGPWSRRTRSKTAMAGTASSSHQLENGMQPPVSLMLQVRACGLCCRGEGVVGWGVERKIGRSREDDDDSMI